MKFEIEIDGDRYFTVRCGDRYQDKLCWDEMLGLIARVTQSGAEFAKALRTREEHAAYSLSSIGDERRREQSYTALCGLSDGAIESANELFSGDVEGRLKFLLGASRQ